MTIPLSLYIHFPWCVRKCPYCDFNSHALRDALPEDAYIAKLLEDLRTDLPLVKNRSIHSIFMGGGTPSLFSAKQIKYLLKEIQELIAFENDNIEITLEANPGTFEQEKFSGFREAGINRLSIGVQSFQADKLKSLGRIHDGVTAQQAIIAAKNAGFHNFNIDLMHGLPKQSKSDALYDLETALSFSPPHLSWYQLTLEPNTLFHHKPPMLPKEKILLNIQEAGHDLLIQQGYQHYEVSAYCRPDAYARHNMNYWEFGDYLGIGAGAHGKITCLEQKTVTRYSKIKNPRDYLAAKHFLATSQEISEAQLPFEFMLNTLRLQKCILWELFIERTGLTREIIYDRLVKLAKQNLLQLSDKGFTLTSLGHRFLNDVLTAFM